MKFRGYLVKKIQKNGQTIPQIESGKYEVGVPIPKMREALAPCLTTKIRQVQEEA